MISKALSSNISSPGPKKPFGATRKKRIVGRGAGSGSGKTAGRGTKGQNSRSGGGVRPGFEGGQMPLFRRVARRGFSNKRFQQPYTIINIDALERFNAGDIVSSKTLAETGLIKSPFESVKILGRGDVSMDLKIHVAKLSESARAKIEAAGGTVKLEQTANRTMD